MFFFILNRDGVGTLPRIDPKAVLHRLMPFAPPDRSGVRALPAVSLLVHALHWNTTRSRLEETPLVDPSHGLSIASWARLDNRAELGGKLGIPATELAGLSDTRLILASYRRWGEECASHLIGDFAFVVHDERRGDVLLARDPLGARPLYYWTAGPLLACSTTLAVFRGLDGLSLQVRSGWIAEYLQHLSMSFEQTPYEGVRKLPPGHILWVSGEETRLKSYFRLAEVTPLVLRDSREYVEAYREVLEESIRCRLDSDYPLGCESSGGLDSSTVTAYAAKLLGPERERAHAFSFARQEQEPRHILAVSRAAGLPYTHVFTRNEPDTRERIDRSIAVLGYPVEHGNATAHEPFYRLAERLGVRTLLSGFGGDEFCTTIHGTLVPLELLQKGEYRKLWQILPGNPLTRMLRLLKRVWTLWRPASANPHFYKAFERRWPLSLVRDEWVEKYGLKERYFEQARFDTGYTELKRFTLEKRWQPFVPTRMENCSLMALSYGIEYRWPLLDVRLVRLFLAIPNGEQYFRGMGRYLHRRAVDGVVPKAIAWKQGKSMGPFDDGGASGDAGISREVERLHPALERILDLGKLRAQIAFLPITGRVPEGDPRGFACRRNLRAVALLNAWLKALDMG
ncbi:MAG TPA: asparagine synthase-related protein [Candidatus Aminicenantes bacterium]|nr:asparagine synthase-related protein [Candidatus Aminicenantes bacterium]